jgi:hypothetical protein
LSQSLGVTILRKYCNNSSKWSRNIKAQPLM